MKLQHLSVKQLCLLIVGGLLLSMLAVTAGFYALTANPLMLLGGAVLICCAVFWMFLLIKVFERRLAVFSKDLCRTLDDMISGNERPKSTGDRETLFDRINHRLLRLYGIMQESRKRADAERQEVQMLVSDISHQVKTPVSNLKMITETLLTRTVTKKERTEFLQGIRSQTDKLDFLFQTLVKTSRLETGVIRLEKKDGLLFETLALACSGIVYAAEIKSISVTVDCSENLRFMHDRKWTAEALFNLLDNAVKYTHDGGRVGVSVSQWEMYVKIDVSDTGKGIAESRQASVFRRFYREEEVSDEPGVGIGLYLAREIITRQGGYIKLTSKVGEGSTFSVFLPCK